MYKKKPNKSGIVRSINFIFRLNDTDIEETLVNLNVTCKDCSRTTYVEFVKLLNIPSGDIASQQLFKIYDKVRNGQSTRIR